MIQQQRVTIIPKPSGCIFVNEEGEQDVYLGAEISKPILALLEAAAGPVTIEFSIEVEDECPILVR